MRGRLKGRERSDRRESGSVATIFALAFPVLAVAAVAGMQLSYVVNTRMHAQDVADSAALMGASQLSVAPYQASERAASWARTQLASEASSSTFRVMGSIEGRDIVRVSIDTYTPSFFGDFLPKDGFRSHAEANAEQLSQSPLCVLAHGVDAGDVALTGTAQLAGACMVHGNHDVVISPGARLAASRTEAAGSVRGVITPAGFSDASAIADPFKAVDLTFPTTCSGTGSTDYFAGTLSPGFFNNDLNIVPGASVMLNAGVYYICGRLTLGKNSSLSGDKILLIFGGSGQFSAAPGSTVSISGLQSGARAGFVMATTRDATQDFHLNVDRFARITGAIYLPAAKLVLDGAGPGAQASDWTVIASHGLSVTGSANVVINTNYAGSYTPVPIGVGDRAPKSVRLVH